MKPRQVHRMATFVLSTAMVVIGVALIVSTFSDGGSSVSTGLLLGVLFVAAGCARWYVEVRRSRGA